MKRKSRTYRVIGLTANFLDNEYGANSFDSAFSEDMGLGTPATPIIGILLACTTTALTYIDKDKAENCRDAQKGLRDIQNVDQGLAGFSGHKSFFNPYTLLFGSIYAVLLMAIRWDKIQQEQQIESNFRTAAHLRAMTHGAVAQDIQSRTLYENNFVINRWRMSAHAVSGSLTGVYTGFSAFQVTNFICLLAPSIVINPLPFVIMGFVLAAVFCVKRLYDQHRLNIKKNISVLECDLQRNKLHCRQLEHNIASITDSKQIAIFRQQLEFKKQDVETNRQQLVSERKKLQTVTQQGNNFINISQKTLSAVKNNTLGMINLANFVSYTGVASIKIAGGASLLSILGGPVAVALTVVVVATLLLYVGYNMYNRHQAHQQRWVKHTPETEIPTSAVVKPEVIPEMKNQHMQFFRPGSGLTCSLKTESKPPRQMLLSKL